MGLLWGVTVRAEDADAEDEDEDEEDFPESVHVLKDGTFDDFVKSHERVLVEFYAPWCGHCQQLEPEYNQAADALRMEGAKSVLAKVDATAEPGLAERFEVKSYPTLKYILNGGDPIEYDGPRKADGIAEWLRKREKPAVEEIAESEAEAFVEKALGANSFAVVAHLKQKSARAKAFFKSAEALADYKASKLRFAAVWLPKTADPKKDARMAMSRPGMSDPDPKKLDFSGPWTDGGISKWVKQSTYGAVGSEFKLEKYGAEAVGAVGAKGSVVGIFEDEEAGKALAATLHKVAAAEPQWRCTAVLRKSLDAAEAVADKGGASQITVLHGEKRYVLQDDLTPEAVKKLLADVLAKKAKPYYKSAPPPAQVVEDGVTVLTGETFEQIAMDPKKDVFVEFYAPWCGHCQKLSPVWSELAKKVEKDGFAKKGVVVAKMDSTANECEESVSGFPTLVLYPAVKKEKKMRQKLIFSGARDFDPLMDFLVENAVNLEGVELGFASLGKKPSLARGRGALMRDFAAWVQRYDPSESSWAEATGLGKGPC
ncbi:unnamed protein product [Effrenium voratum]|uniref:Protein disulfide-isomerase n=1 Tax=Effrenium voratum TaxID=2562239 RepID=A0AA36I1B5_9DINO|nr:unnamed protein product [Effrenium voratum]